MRRPWTLRQKGGGKWQDKGYMGMSSKEFVRVNEETSGCMRGGERFRQEKRQRIGEGPATIETQNRKGKPQEMK